MIKFKIGDWVRLKRLKKTGQIDSLTARNARIFVGTVAISCKLSELEGPVDPPEIKESGRQSDAPPATSASIKSLENLDLHGLRTEAALSALETRIDQAILAGLDRIKVIHGIGDGKIREALLKMLPSLRVVKSFSPDITNAGVTWVYL